MYIESERGTLIVTKFQCQLEADSVNGVFTKFMKCGEYGLGEIGDEYIDMHQSRAINLL